MINWDAKNWISFIIGLVILVLGIIPLLNKFNIISFAIPASIMTIVGSIVFWIIAGAGLYMLIDGFMLDYTARTITLIVALVILVIGLIPLLNQFGVIGFNLPYLGLTFYYVVFVIEGLFLIAAAFQMY